MIAPPARDEFVNSLPRGQFLLIVVLFWMYVTLSNLLYAEAMSIAFSSDVDSRVFAPWHSRLLQHLLLLPFAIAAYAWAMRIGFSPWWKTLPLQLVPATLLCMLARPALLLAEVIFHDCEGLSGDCAMGSVYWLKKVFMEEALASWVASFTVFLVAYGFGLAILAGYASYRRLRDRELQIEQLQNQWMKARLSALRMQLSPHTLFNLLHTIRGQIGWDPRAAQAMIVQLSDLLRRLLTAGERDMTSLRDELKFARLYLELQRQRFSDRLSLALPADDEVPDVQVPSLILQPLVENAVVHGLEGHPGPVRISIEVVSAPGGVRIDVCNDLATGHTAGVAGIGLANVRERLAVHYGARASIEAGVAPDGRWCSRLRIPTA